MLTRRRLLATGGAAAAALVTGPSGVARASAPSPLVRSSYTGLRSRAFASAAGTLTLVGVYDVAGARAGSDNAFSLMFHGPSGLSTGRPTPLHHPEFGAFDLSLSPVGSGSGAYEAVVNRSVAPHQPAEAPPDQPAAAAEPERGRRLLRRALAHRSARGAAITLTVAPDVEQVSAWLVRGRRVLAARSRVVRGRRVRMRLRARRALRAGRHDVVVIATTADGVTDAKRIRARRRR